MTTTPQPAGTPHSHVWEIPMSLGDLARLYDLFVFDWNWTLVCPQDEGKFPKSAADWKWLPDREKVLSLLPTMGCKLALFTNQGGVGYGIYDEGEMTAVLEDFARQAGLHAWRACYTHPGYPPESGKKQPRSAYTVKDDPRRKPGPGMILEIIDELGTPPHRVLVVGDMPEDEGAALSAGADFMHADLFFFHAEAAADATATGPF